MESFLVDAGEEACEILIDQNKAGIDRADRKMSKRVYMSPEAKWFGQATGMSWKIIRAIGCWNWSERGVHEWDDRSSTLEGLLLFGQNVPGWELTSWVTGSKMDESMKVFSIAWC